MMPKGTMVLWFNTYYADFPNLFFSMITYLGDGLVIPLVAVVMLWFRYSFFGTVAFMGITQLLVVQGLKRYVFGPIERPAAYFSDAMPPLNFVEGVDIHNLFAMPSGHTATAFSVAFILVLLLKPGKFVTILLFLLASLVGLSRIYLAQHFLVDTLIGCAIGLLLAYGSYFVFMKLEKRYPGAGFFTKSLKKTGAN